MGLDILGDVVETHCSWQVRASGIKWHRVCSVTGKYSLTSPCYCLSYNGVISRFFESARPLKPIVIYGWKRNSMSFTEKYAPQQVETPHAFYWPSDTDNVLVMAYDDVSGFAARRPRPFPRSYQRQLLQHSIYN
jgi:hypothetical protein